MPIGGTWLIPAAIAGAGVTSAVVGASAAKNAANTQAAAANRATDIQQQMYQQTRADLQPFRDLGAGAGSSLSKLLGIGAAPSTPPPQAGAPDYAGYVNSNPDLLAAWNAPGIQQAWNGDINAFGQKHYDTSGKTEGRALPTVSQAQADSYISPEEAALQALPGYQFTKNQGVQTVNRQLGSMGLTGAQAKGISRFVTGLADQTYGEQVNRLQNLTNTGENAGAQTGTIGASYGGGISNTITGAGQAQAAGTVGAANAITGGLGSIPGALLTNSILNGGRSGAATNPGIYGSGYDSSSVASLNG